MPEVYAAPPDYAFPREFKGYGETGLEGLKWPNNAKIAVSFVINYEEVKFSKCSRHLKSGLLIYIQCRAASAQS